MNKLVIIGGVGSLGGALTECWDTLRLWRSKGLEFHVILDPNVDSEWRSRVARMGCGIIDYGAVSSSEANGVLAGSTVVGICSLPFLSLVPKLRSLGCKLAWVNCMTWLFPQEVDFYRGYELFDAYMFQGEFQRAELESGLRSYGYRPEQGHLIRGTIHLPDWPFEPQPRNVDDEFVVGRLGRPDPSKWSRQTWDIYGRINHPRRRALAMGVDEFIRKWLGPAPEWAELLPPCALAAREFYRRIHCLIPVNYSALESWPRIGLEAMALGVPIIAPRQGGWVDMITHGESGFLASGPGEIAAYATQLAHDEDLRIEIAQQARRKLEEDLANPDTIWAGWQRLFQSVAPTRA